MELLLLSKKEFNSSENDELTAIARPRGTGINRTPRNEHNAAKKSSLSSFQSS